MDKVTLLKRLIISPLLHKKNKIKELFEMGFSLVVKH